MVARRPKADQFRTRIEWVRKQLENLIDSSEE
jgi:hypothetical protein